MFGRMDPKEKEKAETCSWVTERVEALNIQIEGMEAEMETLQSKKGKNSTVKERLSELEERIERHQWHQGRLELILRLLENGQIDTDKVMIVYMFGPRPIPLQNTASNMRRSIRFDLQITSLKEDVNYYVDQNSVTDSWLGYSLIGQPMDNRLTKSPFMPMNVSRNLILKRWIFTRSSICRTKRMPLQWEKTTQTIRMTNNQKKQKKNWNPQRSIPRKLSRNPRRHRHRHRRQQRLYLRNRHLQRVRTPMASCIPWKV